MKLLPHDLALRKAKVSLMGRQDSVFFTTLCFSFKFKWDDSIPTAATNGTTMKINPAFFMSLSEEERVFVLVHESMHAALLHCDPSRRQSRDPVKWNIAADHVINLQLEERKFQMPSWVLKDKQYLGMGTEEVYKLLPDPPPGGGGYDCDIEPSDEPSEEHQQQIQEILVRASIQSKMAGDKPGTIPGDIQLYLDRLLEPKLPWNRLLQRYLKQTAKNDYSFKRPNRRFFPEHHLPSLHSIKLANLQIYTDISCSVTDLEFNRFVTETHQILKMMRPDKIEMIQFDTELKSVDVVRNVNELMKVNFAGRGGTMIAPVLERINQTNPQLAIVFSDGEFGWPNITCKSDVLWLIHNNDRFNPPFGKLIKYETEVGN